MQCYDRLVGRRWKTFAEVSGDCHFAHTIRPNADDFRGARERRAHERVDTFLVHMTGRSIVRKAIDKGADPTNFCLRYYARQKSSPHYLCGYQGEIWQLTDDHLRVNHVGVSLDERKAYLDGRWKRGGKARGERREWLKPITNVALRHWYRQWPMYKSPQHLFRTRSVNNISVGVEMPPCTDGRTFVAEPFSKGSWHTAAQHTAIALLACDVAERWSFPPGWFMDPRGGPRSPRLPGHEDVDLYGRSHGGGGWDPGALRDSPRWNWAHVHNMVALRLAVGSLREFLRRVADKFGRQAVGVA